MAERGNLELSEPHPAARSALEYVARLGLAKQSVLLEAFASCAIEGNRLAEVCGETLRRVMYGEPVSDRYILGLAWAISQGEGREGKDGKTKAPKAAAPRVAETL